MHKQKGEATSNGGIGVLGLLGVVFVTLKLLAIEPVASWSWWWVTAPFWGGLALFLVILGLIAIGALIAVWLDKTKARRW